jgi:peptidoglycan/LPS O-acetylase OafA/YrhL
MTIGEKLDESRGIGLGFDFMRLALAFLVVAIHSVWVVGINDTLEVSRLWWFPLYAILPAFFGLSGFLIASSAERLSLKNFAINRGMRMLPALCVETVISAFIVGAIFTTLPLGEYFRDPGLWRYLANIIGLIQYKLPGVFVGLPSDGVVNLSLWTIGWEYYCYSIMAVLVITGAMKRSYPILLVVAAYALGAAVTQALHLEQGSSPKAAVVGFIFDGEASPAGVPMPRGHGGVQVPLPGSFRSAHGRDRLGLVPSGGAVRPHPVAL